MKKLLFLSVVLIVSGLALSFAMGNGSERGVILEISAVRVFVPGKYLPMDRFWWVKEADGLDDNDDSVVIQILAGEIKAALIHNGRKEVEVGRDLTAVMKILDDSEALRIENANEDAAKEVNQRTGRYTAAVVVEDDVLDMSRLYESPRIMFRWYALLQNPPIDGNDVIALCTASERTNTSCRLTTFVVDGIGVEVNLGLGELRYYFEIKRYMSDLLTSWRY